MPEHTTFRMQVTYHDDGEGNASGSVRCLVRDENSPVPSPAAQLGALSMAMDQLNRKFADNAEEAQAHQDYEEMEEYYASLTPWARLKLWSRGAR